MPVPPPWMSQLEETLAADADGEQLAIGLVVLASVAGQNVPLDADEAHGAARRALLLLAAGGDPARGLDLKGRAVTAMADDLRTVDRQLALEGAMRELSLEAAGLPHVSEAVHELVHAPDLAWRAYAAALLAEELGTDE